MTGSVELVEKTPLLEGGKPGKSTVNCEVTEADDSSLVSEVLTEEGSHLAKTIGFWGSFCLICNNTTGPAMMGLPRIFFEAGLIPTISCIVVVCAFSSLCGTMLSDAIASIPGNENFSHNIDFSGAFHIIAGESWYVVAETLFLISCYAQACAAIVETAQSLDGFLASFLLGRTYGLQFIPEVALVSWSPDLCVEGTVGTSEVEASPDAINTVLEDCTPFHHAGGLVLTLGFLLTTLLFLPLGRHDLKETILVQVLSFIVLFVLLAQFFFEFQLRGYKYPVPLVGNKFEQLAGVVLFNYAFSITVPAWLGEKTSDVSVNKIVWGSSLLSSALFIAFGALGACSFSDISPNMLTLLASSKVHHLTRLCSGLFGVVIIGCGVPVFSVIIKRALANNKICSPSAAMFWGSIFPYCVSWALYQGSLVLQLLNWTGLVVNGMVAFILPMVLALRSFSWREQREEEARKYQLRQVDVGKPTSGDDAQPQHKSSGGQAVHARARSSSMDSVSGAEGGGGNTGSEGTRGERGIDVGSKHSMSLSRAEQGREGSPTSPLRQQSHEAEDSERSRQAEEDLLRTADHLYHYPHLHHFDYSHYKPSTVHPLPSWLLPLRKPLALVIIFVFSATILVNIAFDLLDPPGEEDIIV